MQIQESAWEGRVVLSQHGGLTGHLKDQLGGVSLSLKENALLCRQVNMQICRGAQFLKPCWQQC